MTIKRDDIIWLKIRWRSLNYCFGAFLEWVFKFEMLSACELLTQIQSRPARFVFDSLRIRGTEGERRRKSLSALFLKYKPVKLVGFNNGRTTSTTLLIAMWCRVICRYTGGVGGGTRYRKRMIMRQWSRDTIRDTSWSCSMCMIWSNVGAAWIRFIHVVRSLFYGRSEQPVDCT